MKRSLITALLLALGIGAWILSGQIDFPGDRAGATAVDGEGPAEVTEETAAESAVAVPVRVRGRALTARKRRNEIVVRGRTEAVRTVDIRAETYGRVVEVAVREGARVKTGAVLVRLAAEDREERMAEAKSLVRQREIEYEAARRLAEKGYRAQTKTAAAAAALDAARAAVARMRTEIERIVVRAPFDGIIEVRRAEIGTYLKVGDVIATLVDEDPFLVIGYVSERDVGRLRLGMPASARLVDGQQVSGKLRFIATAAEPTTRTFRIEIEVTNPERRLRAGITSEIRLAVEVVYAHFVSPALLTLNDGGELGIRIVNAEGVVEFRPARIVADGTDGVWLGGLPENITVITVGQEFVRQGDRVEVMMEAAESPS